MKKSRYLTPKELRMGHADVETATRFPHLHSPDCGDDPSLLNSTPSTFTVSLRASVRLHAWRRHTDQFHRK